MNRLKDFLLSIHGGVYITIFIIVAASQLEPIMEFLHKRKIKVERDRLIQISKKGCIKNRGSSGQKIQSCLNALEFAKEDGDNELVSLYMQEACELGNTYSCYEISLSKVGTSKINYLEKACLSGAGGFMRACGELGVITSNEELLKYACKSELKEFCNKTL